MDRISDEDLDLEIKFNEPIKNMHWESNDRLVYLMAIELKRYREADNKQLDIKEQLKLIREKCPDVWNMKTIGCPADWLVVEDKFCSID